MPGEPGTGAKRPLFFLESLISFLNNSIRGCSLINCCFSPPCCNHAKSWLMGTRCKYHRGKDGLCSLTANACTEHGGMNDFWNVNLTGRCVRPSTCTKRWGESEREREREASIPASLSAPKLRLSHRCGAERTTIPPSSTRFPAYTATSA